MSSNLLQGKVFWVQGAGRWPGPVIARALAENGASVAAVDMTPNLLDPLDEFALQTGLPIRSYVGDSSRGMPARALLDEILSDWGRIDGLILNQRVELNRSVMETDEYDWGRTLEMNLNGAFLTVRLAAEQMKAAGGGVIMAVVSDPARASGMSAATAASQNGILAFVQTAARELIAYNIYSVLLSLESSGTDSLLTEKVIQLCAAPEVDANGRLFRVLLPRQAGQ